LAHLRQFEKFGLAWLFWFILIFYTPAAQESREFLRLTLLNNSAFTYTSDPESISSSQITRFKNFFPSLLRLPRGQALNGLPDPFRNVH
jgi:hypothetical protein